MRYPELQKRMVIRVPAISTISSSLSGELRLLFFEGDFEGDGIDVGVVLRAGGVDGGGERRSSSNSRMNGLPLQISTTK